MLKLPLNWLSWRKKNPATRVQEQVGEELREQQYTYCESVHGIGPWHIRKLSDKGPKFGGGIDTQSLCGMVQPIGTTTGHARGWGGWDIHAHIIPTPR